MKILSICVGLPQKVRSRGQTVLTSIYKSPVEGRVRVSRLNVAGDQQSDLTVHGGFDKAVYAYPSEHYPGWRQELGMEIPWGMFGENLTTEGLTEETVCIGDRLRAGSVEFVVTQPRMPCFKARHPLWTQGHRQAVPPEPADRVLSIRRAGRGDRRGG
jgi:MOSC domain-containing protein YiiM